MPEEARNELGETALITAAKNGEVGKVKQLLDASADMEATDKWGRTALMWCAREGWIESLRLLVRLPPTHHAAAPSATAARTPLHPGHVAPTRSPLPPTPLVLPPQVERGAALDTLDKYGTSAFRWAAQTKNDSCAQHLVASGATYLEGAQIGSGVQPAPCAGPAHAHAPLCMWPHPPKHPRPAPSSFRAQKSTRRCSRLTTSTPRFRSTMPSSTSIKSDREGLQLITLSPHALFRRRPLPRMSGPMVYLWSRTPAPSPGLRPRRTHYRTHVSRSGGCGVARRYSGDTSGCSGPCHRRCPRARRNRNSAKTGRP